MKNNYLTLLFLFFVCFAFAQTKDSLSVEEQARREKNIQAGNPFKKFGYKPKIATLSKGKYLEFHDLDSIVKIGSFSYHVKDKLITGYSKLEPNNSEAGLSPEVISRWLSPDPLASEFPSWSPYNFVLNNPVRMVDPTGMAPEDWIKSNKTGKFEWRNEVTSVYNTPKNYTYVGKTDNSIVTNLFGKATETDVARDMGAINVNDFNNKYSAKGAAVQTMTTKTTMSVGLSANVSSSYNSDGSLNSKEFNGIDVTTSISGEVVAPYPGVDITLGGNSMSIGGNAMGVHTPSANGEFAQGGDVSTLTYDYSLSSGTIQNNFGKSSTIGVSFQGQYYNNGRAMSYPTILGAIGFPNPTNLNVNLNFNNTANPVVIDKTNN